MRRRTLTVLAALASVAALSTVGAATSATPALARSAVIAHTAHTASPQVLTIVHLQETSNPTVYLVTDGTVPYGKAETGNPPGRDLSFFRTGNTYSDPAGLCISDAGNVCPVYQIELNSGYCLAADNLGGSVEIRDCSNANTLWAFVGQQVTTDARWISVNQSTMDGFSMLMAGTKTTGNVITLCAWFSGCNGYYTNWDGV